MRKLLGITLGIMTALGGFVDFGQIVFTLQAGASFRYALLWPVVLGTIAIIVYMEMCGRIAVVAREPVFAIVRDRLGKPLGSAVLVASNLLNLITCAAELGGIAIVLHLLTGLPERLLLAGAAVAFGVIVFVLNFQWIERIFGLAGLAMVVAAISAWKLGPDWKALAHGIIPAVSMGGTHSTLRYWYFAVGIFSAMLMEYEVHFYSSGALEEHWTKKDLPENFMVASLGSVLGAGLTVALLAIGAMVFLPQHRFPQTLSVAVSGIAAPLGRTGYLFVLLGTLACLAGASVETMLSGGYNLCQFYNLPWGKSRRARDVPAFSFAWVGMLVLAVLIALSGFDPLKLVNISVVFGMVVMPLTYYPIMRAAMDRGIMKSHVNSPTDTALGIVFLILITVAAVAAIPLMVLTDSGQP
ncbi:MAG TPA: divalent metal cation transporter [Bryobacteraceae bacterium]|nr:divalent metal cation transporter [Bryobacteraceae bacterium]